MTDDVGDSGPTRPAVIILGSILALLVVDLLSDSRQGLAWPHLVSEGVATGLAVAGVTLLIARLRRRDREQRRLERRLESSRQEAALWRREASDLITGLRHAMEAQFDRWDLSPAERQVAVLLLQGLSHKQIAGRRGASERTVRQQAHILYRKAGLGGRADLAGFFLQDLLARQESDPRGADRSPAERHPAGGR